MDSYTDNVYPWYSGTAITTTTAGTWNPNPSQTYNPTWPQPTYPAAYTAEGWKCCACDLVMAPWVPYHRCDGGTAGVTAATVGNPPSGLLTKTAGEGENPPA